MDELHDAIAAYLRQQHPTRNAASDLPPIPPSTEPRTFACRFCAVRVEEGKHGDSFHFIELWDAVSCAGCHQKRLAQEAAAGGPGALPRQGWHHASAIVPRCKRCGEAIRDGGGRFDIAKLRAERVCAEHHGPK